MNPTVAWALRVIGFADVSAFLERMNGGDPIEFLHGRLRWLQLNFHDDKLVRHGFSPRPWYKYLATAKVWLLRWIVLLADRLGL